MSTAKPPAPELAGLNQETKEEPASTAPPAEPTTSNDSAQPSAASPRIPEGLEFLDLAWDLEHQCESYTRQRIETLGTKAPKCFRDMGTVLSFLDRMATCWWGCKRGDHIVECLIGRVASSAHASLGLMLRGYYDESLSITRSIGEIANLFALFASDGVAFERWKCSDKRTRLSEFSPFSVRKALENLSVKPPVEKERYSLLCEVGTHVTPQTKPQAHNIIDLPASLGGRFQEEGLFLCLNELALSIVLATLYATQLSNIDSSMKLEILTSGRVLAESIGGIDIIEREKRPWFQLDEETKAKARAVVRMIQDAPPEMRDKTQKFLMEEFQKQKLENPT